jgi:uncharacterized membrane protein
MFAIHNLYPYRAYVAYAFWDPDSCGGDGGNWHAIGWFVVEPGSQAVLYSNSLGDVNNRYWYVYGEATDGARWSGNYPMYVTNEAFNICQGAVTTQMWPANFAEIDVGDNDDYVLNLTA